MTLIPEIRFAKAEMIVKSEWLNIFTHEFQFRFSLDNYTVIVGLNNIQLMRPEIEIFEVTDDNDEVLDISEELEEQLINLIETKRYAE